MPVIEIETNIKLEDTKSFVLKLSKFSSEILGKPETLILVKHSYNESLSWAGTFDPAFILSVGSIGTFSPEKNPHFVGEYTKFLKETLGVDEDRGYVLLREPGWDTTGYKGTTLRVLANK